MTSRQIVIAATIFAGLLLLSTFTFPGMLASLLIGLPGYSLAVLLLQMDINTSGDLGPAIKAGFSLPFSIPISAGLAHLLFRRNAVATALAIPVGITLWSAVATVILY